MAEDSMRYGDPKLIEVIEYGVEVTEVGGCET